ncbi:hypothetical protein [Corynebacterium alimapuense]|uniref:Uncharacterized protein n=1 Tax=Corynebacterium alimapuense TaxID=1576874 RepID=A0A3M8KA43_9CORY|nr:hypothetical protein [Corynebacterium alimapuense]RNE50026.1 hypothetical protein C5L39_01260 [Corynebacterium alimapuense]
MNTMDSIVEFVSGTGLILAASCTIVAYLASVLLREYRDDGQGFILTLASSRPLLGAALIIPALITICFIIVRLGVMS